MKTTRGSELAAAFADPIDRLGGGFMRSREAKEYGENVGLAGRPGLGAWQPYFRGRFGVLGEVDAGVVISAAFFFPDDLVRDCWEGGAKVPAADAVRAYAQACHAWGRRRLGGFAAADRLAGLLGAVAERADPRGAPLFAGWRAVPLPDDPPARLAQLAHVLRELRGGLHTVAVRACGLPPRQAILAGPGGAGNAAWFGWPEPHPEVSPEVAQCRRRVEELTDELAGPSWSVLEPDDAAELGELLDQAAAVASAR